MHGSRLGILVGVGLAVAGCGSGATNPVGSNAPTSTASVSVPSAAADASLLRKASWQPGDVRTPYQLSVFSDGDIVVDQVTLDLCGAGFPSEQLRRARHQVGVVDGQRHDAGISIEAVSYDTTAGAAQAMEEVRAAKTNCPTGYVAGDVEGVPPLRYRFGPAPDTTWTDVAGVDRFAVAVTVNDQQGHRESDLTVYQQRGRFLVVLYTGDAATTGRVLTRSLQAFSEVLARRMPTA